MSKPKDGGAAFPSPACGDWSPEYGMTLRDWFAGQALTGLCASWSDRDNETFADFSDEERANLFASGAYRIADAMLAERSKP